MHFNAVSKGVIMEKDEIMTAEMKEFPFLNFSFLFVFFFSSFFLPR